MSGLDYEKAGVSIKKGDDFADFIKGLPSKAVSRGLGGFAGDGGFRCRRSSVAHRVLAGSSQAARARRGLQVPGRCNLRCG